MVYRQHATRDPHEAPKNEPHPWLEEKVYALLRQRTVDLVTRSVDALRKEKQRISLATVAAKSKELDAEGNGRGVSESAILDNQEARAYYELYRNWCGPSRTQTKSRTNTVPTSPGVVKPDRDEQRVRQRYLHMSKETLVERLITTERILAEQREHWLSQQENALSWQ